MFGRGFESFGKQVPIRGMQPQMQPIPAPAPGARLAGSEPPPAPVPQVQPTLQPRPMPPGRIPVYKKGDPNAPPCPVCG